MITRRKLIGRRRAAAVSAGWLIAEAHAQTPAQTASTSTQEWDVRRFGAKGDGKTLDTRSSVQAAIDACNAAGGGRVRFATGWAPF